MKGKMKFALWILLVFMVCAASSVSAAEVIIRNTLDNNVSVAFLYFDRATELWTTWGWWNVGGNASRTIKIENVNSNGGVYYAAISGSSHYVDKSTLNSAQYKRWVIDEPFKINFDGKPKGKNARQILFYKSKYSNDAGAYIIRIDAKPVG